MSEAATEPTPTEAKSETEAPTQLPADHPLVKAFEAQKAEIRGLKDKVAANADAVSKLAEIEEASKTEAQKQADELERLRAENASFKQREQVTAWAKEVSEETEVPANLLRGSTKEELLAHANELKPLLNPSGDPAPPRPGAVSTVGKTPATPPNISLAEQIAAAESEVTSTQRGTAEHRAASERVMSLKAMQLAEVAGK